MYFAAFTLSFITLCTHLQFVSYFKKMSPTQCSSFHIVALGISFPVRVNPGESYNRKQKHIGDWAVYRFLSGQVSNILHHDSLATPTPFFPLWVTFLFWEYPLQLSGEMALNNLLVPYLSKSKRSLIPSRSFLCPAMLDWLWCFHRSSFFLRIICPIICDTWGLMASRGSSGLQNFTTCPSGLTRYFQKFHIGSFLEESIMFRIYFHEHDFILCQGFQFYYICISDNFRTRF